MRRKDRETKDKDEIICIIESCKVMRLALSVDDVPYIVPLNFGYSYENGQFEFYFHCANSGKKLDCIKRNPTVCFEMDCDHALLPGAIACTHGFAFKSIVGSAKAVIVQDIDEKKRLLALFMKHQTGNAFAFEHEQCNTVTLCKLIVDELTAKVRGK